MYAAPSDNLRSFGPSLKDLQAKTSRSGLSMLAGQMGTGELNRWTHSAQIWPA